MKNTQMRRISKMQSVNPVIRSLAQRNIQRLGLNVFTATSTRSNLIRFPWSAQGATISQPNRSTLQSTMAGLWTHCSPSVP